MRLYREFGIDSVAEQYAVVRALFLRLIGLVYALAFASLWVQVEGLVGSGGILPFEVLLDGIRARTGEAAWWTLPTLCWIDTSDQVLYLLCAVGFAAGLLAIFGAAPAIVLFIAWICYLSLTVAGQDFFSFQWDILLLEAGFLAWLWSPWTLLPRWVWHDPPRVVLWLLRILLFRLMFSSGLVKWLSGDATWREMTALMYHYQTQPLPAWTSWFAHQMPDELQVLCVGVMFAIELLVPFCIFAPRAWRLAGALAFVFLQVLIGLTGNYGFFNLLSVVLCLVLLDDRVLARWVRLEPGPGEGRNWPRGLLWPVAGLLLLLGMLQLSRTARLAWPWPAAVAQIASWCRPFYLVNSYGLFAVMTTQRLEIEIEGSVDGESWYPYVFRWKPGAVHLAPAFVQPHMPRLDWQMWFAALRSYRDYPWFTQFMGALLQGKPAVLALLAKNPFPADPPRYVRARLYEYRFTDLRQWREGYWWHRQDRGLYCPVLSLRGD